MAVVYLATLSHAERGPVQSKVAFANILATTFNECYGTKDAEAVRWWAAAEEPHAQGGIHYHVALKLKRSCRYGAPSKKLKAMGLVVNFSEGVGEGDGGRGYRGALDYISKTDPAVAKSEGHPQVIPAEPRTATATRRRQDAKRSRFISDEAGEGVGPDTVKKEKEIKLSKWDVGEMAREKGIKSFRDLMAEAERMYLAGDNTLSKFIRNRGQKHAEEAVNLAQEMAGSIKESENRNRNRVEVLAEFAKPEGPPCSCKEPHLWRRLAEATLTQNSYTPEEFCGAVMDLLIHGRSKGRNLFLVGKANCGKSFLVRPLELIYKALVNPANNTFSFGEIEGKEIVLLDDFRLCSSSGKPVPWSTMLLLLDGGTVNFSLPRTHYATDVCVPSSNTIPVFCTGKAVPVFLEGFHVDPVESEMMRSRFKVFLFVKQITTESMCECSPCAKCFAEMIFAHSHQLLKGN